MDNNIGTIDKQRFLEVCNFLKNSGIVKSLTEISRNIGRNKQFFTDLKSGKGIIFLKDVEYLTKLYNINSDYIFTGNGEIVLSITQKKPELQPELQEKYIEVLEENRTLLKNEKEYLNKIGALQKENFDLKKQLESIVDVGVVTVKK